VCGFAIPPTTLNQPPRPSQRADSTDLGSGAEQRPMSMRTGFSDAWISDDADDFYNLSWYTELPVLANQ
jgi:hypothetical protein